MDFRKYVEEALAKAIRKKKITSIHEGYGLLIEEVDEFFDEVKKKTSTRFREDVVKELSQIAAICERIFNDLYKD
jgi:NTP pyrophosphatase (non-canonical NTP hydrolase)